ncbi:TIGR03032 family protein [Sphingomonas guangdongensis]|uniref:TIGR03032 family protein n=1 Tax=Sphingomonas guangdongensis TaxID=1141890 RepID=A0A285QAG2_9SPHN|nr:TIGR03032 family protein [Sphingomonas guangdongensis]SOB78816.1 TIGR03032 family protein [Sphingomonas guangdongensis]
MAEYGSTEAVSAPVLASPGFADWLAHHDISIALTTYQTGRLIFISRRANGTLRVHERRLPRCQGLWSDGRELLVSSEAMLWRFTRTADDSDPGLTRFVPRQGFVTGAIDIHDIALSDVEGRPAPVFVATAFNLIATVATNASFRPLWRPAFISAVTQEDRCHLNGLATEDGRTSIATAVSRSDVLDGWRERRRDGGVAIDIASGEVIAGGLSMPHSPRVHDGRLLLLDSGRGRLVSIDRQSGSVDEIAFCPGFARGLAITGSHAIIGLSRPRRNHSFEGLALDAELAARDSAARCGLIVVDLERGRTLEWLRFEAEVTELYDVAVLPATREVEAIGFIGPAISTFVDHK